jgi:hypothetical protein
MIIINTIHRDRETKNISGTFHQKAVATLFFGFAFLTVAAVLVLL